MTKTRRAVEAEPSVPKATGPSGTTRRACVEDDTQSGENVIKLTHTVFKTQPSPPMGPFL